MIQEHEIPTGSRLYFQNSAKIKREIENISAKTLDELGYAEIVTPHFSYHQDRSYAKNRLLSFSDTNNNTLYLRADTTVDLARLITKRLGRSVDQKKWFYIQPVFTYPSTENYQIGCENLESPNLSTTLKDSIEVLKKIDSSPLLQISNIQIPKILSKLLDLDIDIFKNSNIQKLLDLKLEWLNKLTNLQNINQIEEILDIVPLQIQDELKKIETLCHDISYDNIVIAPLYYAKMNYYDGLFFRYIKDNELLGLGGAYNYEEVEATGFALYVDKIIEEKIKDEQS